MEVGHRIKNFDEAMAELEDIQNGAKSKPEDSIISRVKCNGCTLCCESDAIRILPNEDVTRWQVVPHDRFPGQFMIAHQPDGKCFYLDESGCSIHGEAPELCSSFDCRLIARRIKKKDLKKYSVPVRVWNKGKSMA